MFLDEELSKIHEEYGLTKGTPRKLIDACLTRLDEHNGIKAFLNSLKRIDASWKLFCKTHPEYEPDGFRNIVLQSYTEDDVVKILKKALNW